MHVTLGAIRRFRLMPTLCCNCGLPRIKALLHLKITREIFASLKFVPAGELRHAYIAAYRHGKGSKSMGSPRNCRLLVLCKNAITELSVLATAEVRNGRALSLSATFFFATKSAAKCFQLGS